MTIVTGCADNKALLNQSPPDAVQSVQLVPDTGGEITRIVISVNSARRAVLRNAELVSNIVNGLPDRIEVLIITNDPKAFTVAQNPWPDRIQFLQLPFANPITIWTQDPFVVVGGANPTLLIPKTFERADDRLMAASVAKATGFGLATSKLHFEGGNIVSDDDGVFIGANSIRYNANELGVDEVDIALQFEQAFGRRVFVVGPHPQPVAHIDMMMTPIGAGRVVLADATAGAQIAEQAIQNDPDSVTRFERYCEDYFFGHPAIESVTGKDGQDIVAPRIQGTTIDMIYLSKLIAPVLDGIAAGLERQGFEVLRVPFLFGGPGSRAPQTDNDDLQAGYPMMTYNNVLIEQPDDRPAAVYLPRYGWPAMDDAAATAWNSFGFKPHPIDGLAISAMFGGALRCSVKVLDRL